MRILLALVVVALIGLATNDVMAQPGGQGQIATGITITDVTCNSPNCTVTVSYDVSIAAGKNAYVKAYFYRRCWNEFAEPWDGVVGWELDSTIQYVSGGSSGYVYEDEVEVLTPPCAMLSYGVKLVVEVCNESGPYPCDVGAVGPACDSEHISGFTLAGWFDWRDYSPTYPLDHLHPAIEVKTAEWGLSHYDVETRLLATGTTPWLQVWPEYNWYSAGVTGEYCDEGTHTAEVFQWVEVDHIDFYAMQIATYDPEVRQEVKVRIVDDYDIVPEEKWYDHSHSWHEFWDTFDMQWGAPD